MIHVVLDINGVLINRIWRKSDKPLNEYDNVIPMKCKAGCMHIFIRPGAIDSLRDIADKGCTLVFWSSMTREYMMPIVDLLIDKAGLKEKWFPRVLCQTDCQAIPHPDPEIKYKPLFLKDEKRIYERYPNTDGVMFIDAGPLKMRLNEDSEIIIVPSWDMKNDPGMCDKVLGTVITNDLKDKINNII